MISLDGLIGFGCNKRYRNVFKHIHFRWSFPDSYPVATYLCILGAKEDWILATIKAWGWV